LDVFATLSCIKPVRLAWHARRKAQEEIRLRHSARRKTETARHLWNAEPKAAHPLLSGGASLSSQYPSAFVFRLKFAPTIFAAQQLVAHGHVLINGKKVDRRSFQVKPGMEISIKPKSQQMPLIKQSMESTIHAMPEYFSADPTKFSGQLLVAPGIDQIPLPLPVNIPMVCEFLAYTS
jgi:hypothetical protein